MDKLVHADQTSFINERSYFLIFRGLFNLIHSPRISNDFILLSPDAAKAFDQLEWLYLSAVLERLQVMSLFHGSNYYKTALLQECLLITHYLPISGFTEEQDPDPV